MLSSINKRFRNLHCRLDLSNDMLPNFQHIVLKFHIEFLLLEARSSLSWRLAQPSSRLSPSTSSSTSLHASFLAFPWLPHHEEFHPLLLFGASMFHHAQLSLKLAQEAKAPRSSSIIWYLKLWCSRAKFLILSLCFNLSVLYTTIFYMSWLFCTD